MKNQKRNNYLTKCQSFLLTILNFSLCIIFEEILTPDKYYSKGENVQALELGKTHSILLVRVNDVSEKTGLSQVDMRLRLA